MKTIVALAFCLPVAWPLITVAQPKTSARPKTVILEDCLVSAFDHVQVPGREAGVLDALDPQTSLEGSEVRKGDILGALDSEDLIAKEEMAELEIEVAKAQAENDAQVQAMILTKKVAEAELKSAEDANRKQPGTITANEIRRLRLTVDRAGYEIEVATLERANFGRTAKIKEAQLKSVRVEIERRKVVSPLDGVIVKRMKQQGEWVQPGESIVEVVRLDRLRVEGTVDTDKHSPREIAGGKVTVTVQTPDRGEVKAEGVIEYVSPVVQGHVGFRVWTEIENRREGNHWLFQPGTVATMEITLQDSDRRAATRPVSTRRNPE